MDLRGPQPGPHIGQVVIPLPGEIGVTSARRAGDQLRAAFRPVTVVIGDGSPTMFCDTSGMLELAFAHRHAAANQAELRIVCNSDIVLRVLQVMGLDRVLRVWAGPG